MTFCQRVVEAAHARPDKVAMTMLGPTFVEELTFGSMVDQIRSVAYCLSREQVNFGDRVAIIGENHPNWAVAYLGILYRGAVVTPLDPSATVGTLASFLGDSEAKLAFVSPASLDKFRAACEQLGRDIPAVALRPSPQWAGLAHYDEWVNTPAPHEFNFPAPTGDDALALLMYTSGTTGRPKAVPLTHGNIYAQSDKAEEVMRVSDREVVLSLLPLFHAYSQIVNLWLATIIGARVVYVAELSSAEIERGLKEGGATALLGVPRLWYLFHKKIFDAVNTKPAPVRWIFKAMLAANGALRDSLRLNAGTLFFRSVHKAFGGRLRLAVSAGAIFDESVARDFHRLGFTILQGYGMTETSGAVAVTRFEDNAVGSVGTPLNGVEVRINEPDEQGVGEILIRGPIVMPGYYRNPEANREAFTPDGWFRSGDLGRFDDLRHLYIVGRKKDVIKLPSGKNVFPEDVEAHYERSPFVSEICVLGVKDEASGFKGAEKLCAVVVPDFDHLKARQITNVTEWVRWELESLGRELPEYQRVHDLIFRAEPLPRTTTRKLRRFELKDELEASTSYRMRGRGNGEVLLGDAELELMNSPAGRATEAAIRRQVSDASVIHPQMNLEIDLRLDSLARAECFTYVEQALGIEFASEDVAAALTVGELILLASAKTCAEGALSLERAAASASESARDSDGAHWHRVLACTRTDVLELRPLLKRKPVTELLARTVLWLTYVWSRLLFRMEVTGRDILKRLDPPYLICPNHQSYIDPFLVCSTYPHGMLPHVVHVGSRRYFKGFVMTRLARLINVLPVDPDVHLLRAMRTSAAALREGKILNIYPEGHRSFDGRLQEFKKGTAILATELNVPIVPVAIDGTYRIWPRESWHIRAAKVRISFGEPIDVRKVVPGETDVEVIYARVTALLEERIHRMLGEARARV